MPEKLYPVFETPNKAYRGAYGGRGGAKTIAFARRAIYDIMRLSERHKPWRFLCGRELQKSLKDSVFSVIASQIDELGVSEAFHVGKEFIRCKNGNEFLFYGIKSNIAEVKGLHGVRRTWLEEAQKVSQSSLSYLIPTVMRDFPDCELWASWNPNDEDDPIHKMFVTNSDESVICQKINYYDNPWFPASLEAVRLRDKKNSPDLYEWIWEGKFNKNDQASVYGKWISRAEDGGRIRDGVYDPSLPVNTAWDLGYSDDTAIIFWQTVGGEIRIIDYYENNREDVIHYAEQIYGRSIAVINRDKKGKILKYHVSNVKTWGAEHRAEYNYSKNGQFVPHDAANKLLQAGGRSALDQLAEVGIVAHAVPAVSQQTQIDMLRRALPFMYFEKSKTQPLIKALKKYKFLYDEERNKFSDKPDHDSFSHACDALEIVGQVYKFPVESSEVEKPRFLHEMTAEEMFWPKTEATHDFERI